MSNDTGGVKVPPCHLSSGFGRKIQTQLWLEHAVLVHMQCVLASLRNMASQLADRHSCNMFKKVNASLFLKSSSRSVKFQLVSLNQGPTQMKHNQMESDGLIRGGVDVENLQVVVWQDKFYSKEFCATRSGSLDFNGGDGIS